jgi:hypothetical protein
VGDLGMLACFVLLHQRERTGWGERVSLPTGLTDERQAAPPFRIPPRWCPFGALSGRLWASSSCRTV